MKHAAEAEAETRQESQRRAAESPRRGKAYRIEVNENYLLGLVTQGHEWEAGRCVVGLNEPVRILRVDVEPWAKRAVFYVETTEEAAEGEGPKCFSPIYFNPAPPAYLETPLLPKIVPWSSGLQLWVDEIKKCLDGGITHWREKLPEAESAGRGEEELIARCSIDVFQSVRMSLFGEMLPPAEGPATVTEEKTS